MSTKFKILSTISFICLALVLTFVGVWAMTDLDFVVGGNIEYTAPEKPQGYTVTVNCGDLRVVLYKINDMTDFVECEPFIRTFTLEDVWQIEITTAAANAANYSTNPSIYSGYICEKDITSGMLKIEQDIVFTIIADHVIV